MDKIAKEKEFHNRRYNKEIRQSAWKFYSIEKASRNFFEDTIVKESFNKRVLELGCGKNTYIPRIADKTKSSVGIDISEVAIKFSKNRVKEMYLSEKANFYVMNAEQLEFDDSSFDLIIGSSIIHHLDLKKFFEQLSRVMSREGKAVFIEPQGQNFFINLYRKFTPKLRTEDEHPLIKSDYLLMKKYFRDVRINYFHLFTLLVVPFRNWKMFSNLLSIFEKFDKIFFNLPLFRHQAWQVVIELGSPIKQLN